MTTLKLEADAERMEALIAAAPELLAALRAIADQEGVQIHTFETRMQDMADIARAALAKVDA